MRTETKSNQKRWIILIAALVAVTLGIYNIYSSFSYNFSPVHIDKVKMGLSIMLVAIAVSYLYKKRKILDHNC
jgi:divalent metal cation (Fe/Co/Zn/Cd) transporter